MKNWHNNWAGNKASHSPISHGNHSVWKAKQSTWSELVIVRNSPVRRNPSPNGCLFPSPAFVKQFKQTSTPILQRYILIRSPELHCRLPPKVNHRATNLLKDKPQTVYTSHTATARGEDIVINANLSDATCIVLPKAVGPSLHSTYWEQWTSGGELLNMGLKRNKTSPKEWKIFYE